MLQLQRRRPRALVVSRLWSRRWASASAEPSTGSLPTSTRRWPRSKWRRTALATACAVLVFGHSALPEDAVTRQRLMLRCGWTLSAAFVAYTDVRSDLFGRSGVEEPNEDEEKARAARRIQWWAAIQRARDRSSSLRHQLIWILVDLMVPSEGSDEDDKQDRRRELVRSLAERGVLELLVDYVAIEKPTDVVLLKKIQQCLQLALDGSMLIQEQSEPRYAPKLSTVHLGAALGHLLDHEVPRYGDLVRLGESLLQLERLGADPMVARHARSLMAPQEMDETFGRAVRGYLCLLSPEMPPMMKEFAMNSLSVMLQAGTRLKECSTTRELDALFTPASATLLLALPRGNESLQQRAATLTSSLVQVAQLSSVPVHDDVYDLWLQQIRWWARENGNPTLQLASANCLRVLSSHPYTRHFVRDSPESMEALFSLARQLHEAHLKQSARTKKSKHKQPAKVQVPSLVDQVEQALIQKHLSKAFLNVCTSYKSGGTAILETMSSSSDTFHTKRKLPMSKVFRGAQDIVDLPVFGAEEYDYNTEFGWADILTHWTGSSDRDIRRNAIESLVHLVEHESDTAAGIQRQQLLLQAWLASMLQHVRNITGGEEILAIKQFEDIARISDEFTPGNERIVFNPAVVDAGASALAILTEQHYDELIHYGVVPLMSLLATKCCSDSRFDYATQSARVIANLVAACSKTLKDQQTRPGSDLSPTAEITKSALPAQPFSYSHPLWNTFFAEVFDVGEMLETTSSGQKLLQILKTWREREDPYQRSQLYRALANLAAYRELARSGSNSLPIYAEGVHPIVSHGDAADDVATLTESDVDVVFVHGLRGDAFGTWRTDMGDAIDARTDVWPDILLYEDLKKCGFRARILSLGYEAGMVSWSSPWPSLTLQERAKLMLNALYAAQVGGSDQQMDTPRPIVFVTHSMGGILVKKMLLQSKSSEEDVARYTRARPLADCTKGVVFLAVPHFGSDLARGARSEAVRRLLRTHPAIQDLCASHDRRLENLNDSFAELHIDCLSVAEQKPAPLGFGLSAMVVKPDSANPGIGSFFILPNADHMTICKAKHHDDPMYQSVLDFVMEHIPAATNRQVHRESRTRHREHLEMLDVERPPTLPRYKTSDKYRVVKQISKGSYGDVFVAERIEDRMQVCLKQVDLDFLSPSERIGCLSEVRLLQSLPQHRNVVTYFDAFWGDTSDCGGGSRFVLVLEYGDAGDLESFIQAEYLHHQALAAETALDIFAQAMNRVVLFRSGREIVSGLAFLHQQRVLHRDIKSKNVFRFSDGRVVVGDFGTCKSLTHTTALAHTLVGSPLYMSPELLDDQPYSFSSDVWSLGCLLYELFAGRTPFIAASYPAVVLKITKGVYEPLSLTAPVFVHEIVARMLSLDPAKRPTADELLRMESVQSRLRETRTSRHTPSVTPTSVSTTSEDVSDMGGTEKISETKGDKSLLLPPPPQSTLPATAISTQSSEPLPAPPAPPTPSKTQQKIRRDSSQVFPTTRASIADILSKERLNVHKERSRQAATKSSGAKFLSCVPVMETERSLAPSTRRAPKAITMTAAANPRAVVPPENMLIIGTKVSSVKTPKQATPRRCW